jgi:hypothetical protein
MAFAGQKINTLGGGQGLLARNVPLEGATVSLDRVWKNRREAESADKCRDDAMFVQ